MTTYLIKAHEVTAVTKIVGILPLTGRNSTLMAPDQGLLLVLDSGEKTKWLAEPNRPVPQIGDAFVTDAELGVSLIVPAERFVKLFEAVAG